MENLKANSRVVSPSMSEPPSPSSALDFPDTAFSPSTKRKFSQQETDSDESLTEKQRSSLHETVRFSQMASVKETLSRHDMSIKERCNYWIQDHEYEAIRLRNKTRSRNAEESQDSDGECSDLNQYLDRVEEQMNNGCSPDVEIELHKDYTGPGENRRPAIKDDFYEHADIFYSEIFEDDAFADICFSVDSGC